MDRRTNLKRQGRARGGRRRAAPLPELPQIGLGRPDQEHVLRMSDLMGILRLRRPSIYGLIKREAFPKPIRLTRVQRGWLASDVRKWLEQRQMERDADAQ